MIRNEKCAFEESKQNVSEIENNKPILQTKARFCGISEKSDLKTSKIAAFGKHPLVFVGVGMLVTAVIRLHFTDDPQRILGLHIAVIIGIVCIVAGWIFGRLKLMESKNSAAKCHKAERCKYGSDCPRRYSPLSDWFACFELNKINSARVYKSSGKKKGGK